MIPLVKLKQELEFTRDLGDIVDVLKTAALIQFRAVQAKRKPNEKFSKQLENCFSALSTRTGVSHPYLIERRDLVHAIIIVTSDEGFLGELNTLLINTGIDLCKTANDEIIVLGERGAGYLDDLDKKYKLFAGVNERTSSRQAQELLDYVLGRYIKNYSTVSIVYPKFISLTSQKVKVFKALPFEKPLEKAGVYKKMGENLLIEPSERRVLAVLVKLWLKFKFVEIFWSAKQAEFAARIMHLEGSTQGLSAMNKKISFSYFRQLHAISDKTIREVSASKVLLKKH